MLCESGTTLVNEDLMMMMDCVIHSAGAKKIVLGAKL